MSDPGSIRYSVGGGALTVSNGLMVFVAPGGAVADEWSELALAPATEAELAEALEGELPADHYVAVVQLHDGGAVLLCEPDGQRFSGRVERSVEGHIRFGMAPSATSSLWVGSGVVGASGLEVVGFGLAASNAEVAPSEPLSETVVARAPVAATEPAPAQEQPPLERAPEMAAMLDDDITIVDLPVPTPPRCSTSRLKIWTSHLRPHLWVDPPNRSTCRRLRLRPVLDPPVLDPPVLSTSLFPDLPVEAPPEELGSNPIIERTPTPPPPGLPVVEPALASAGGRPVSLVFDDGQTIPLTSTMAVGRAPEGSEHAPPGCVVLSSLEIKSAAAIS